MPYRAGLPLTTEELQVHEHSLIELVKLFWPTLRAHRWRTLLGCSLIAVAGGTYGLMPLFSKALFDVAIARQSMAYAFGIAGAFVLVHTARLTTWYLAMRQILLIQEKLTFALRSQGFSHLQRLSLRFHGRYPSGYLYQAIFGTAINAFAGCMQTVFKQISLYITALIISLICCLLLSVPMTAVVLLGSVGYVILGRWLSPQIYRRTRESIDAQNAIADYIVDRLRGTHTIQSLAIEDQVQNEFESRLWPTQLKSLEVAKQNFQLNLLTEGTGYLTNGASCSLNE
ncbi:MAG: ABC transporter ATP-binding protein [Phycisphaeraceae bacterium]|nr:ABC transporter ATP-binding protein [Phycisphaeraceae bacterium]